MARIFVLALTETGSTTVELLAGRPLLVGRGPGVGLQLDDARAALRHLTLTARTDGVVVEELRGASGTQLNDVQVSGQALARGGDEVRVGDARLVVALENDAPLQLKPRLASHDELSARLDDELLRARGGRQVGLALVGLPPLNASARQALVRRLVEGTARTGAVACWGEFSADVLAVIVPEPDGAVEVVFAKLPSLAGQRARVATVVSRADGLHSEVLWERALERLHAVVEVEPVVVDPVMVRLREAVERIAKKPAAVAFVGSPGCGRGFLARALAEAANGPVVEGQGAWPPSLGALLEARSGSVLLLRDADALDPPRITELTQRAREKRSWLALTSTTLQPLQHVLKVPALTDRPTEVLPLAESFLASERRLLNRPRLALGTDARTVLSRYRWPGNVRELRNVMARAARSAVRDELGRDALPARLSSEAPEENLRGALKAAEREMLLEALARTRWNVTAAAGRLGIPRRTVVYRMQRLGLKRPAR
jgi:hypothetical protein